MNAKQININEPISYLLSDDGELDHAMYLAAAYSNFIQWQNNFFHEILNTMTNATIKMNIKESIQKTIVISDAKK